MGAIAKYFFADNLNDSSGNGHTLGLQGTATYSAYSRKGAKSFVPRTEDNSVAGFLKIPTTLNTALKNLGDTGAFTIQFITALYSVTDEGVHRDGFIWRGDGYPVGTGEITLSCTDSTSWYPNRAWMGINEEQNVSDSPFKHDLTWQVAQVQYNNGTGKIFIDGTCVYTKTSTKNPFTTDYTTGQFGATDSNTTHALRGHIDSIYIVDYAANGSEILDPPSVFSVSPDYGSVVGGDSVIITGSAFRNGATVSFGGSAATGITVVNSTTITCTTPAHAKGTVDIVVINTDAQAGTLISGYAYKGLELTSISPATGTILGGAMVTLTGEQFAAGMEVHFGSYQATNVTIISDTSATCLSPSATLAGLVSITVTTGTQTDTLTDCFTFYEDEIYKPAKKIILKVNGNRVDSYSKSGFTEKQELNILTKGYDFAFDGIDFDVPLDFTEHFSRGSEVARYENLVKVYKGYVSGQKFNLRTQRAEIKSLPYTDLFSKYSEAFTLSARNPMLMLRYFFDEFLPVEYRVGNLVRLSGHYPNVPVAIDTDGGNENVKAIVGALCEAYDVGIYNDGLTINAFAAPMYWPKAAEDITPLLVEQPEITEESDNYYTRVELTYKTDKTAGEATVTSGSGDLTLTYDMGSLYVSAAVAQLIADRKKTITEKVYYSIEATLIKSMALAIGSYFMLDDYIFVLTSKQRSREDGKWTIGGIGIKIT